MITKLDLSHRFFFPKKVYFSNRIFFLTNIIYYYFILLLFYYCSAFIIQTLLSVGPLDFVDHDYDFADKSVLLSFLKYI